MKYWSVLLLPAVLIFGIAVEARTVNTFYSQDEYRLAQSMFDGMASDLNKAQSDVHTANLGDSPRFDIAHSELGTLQQNWDHARFDSGQIDDTITALRMVVHDNRLTGHDRDVLYRDLSRLLDFRTEYY